MRAVRAARPLLVPALVLAVAVAAGIAARHFGAVNLALATLARDGEGWRSFAGLHLVLALAVFVAAYALALFCFVPVALVLTFASGFLFSPFLGAAASIAGACAGASLSYAFARFGLRQRTGRSPAWARLGGLLDGLRARVFRVTFSVRLLPLTPFTLFSLAAGGMRAAFWPYLAGTALGVTPECVAYAWLGRRLGALLSAGRAIQPGDIVQPGLLIPLAILAAVSFGSVLKGPRTARP